MGFFYQALKKAAGVATDAPEDPSIREVEASTAVADVVPDRPTEQPRLKRRFDLKHPIESLIAILAPPVEDQNIRAMEDCRILRARIWETMRNKGMKSVLMTSAMPGDGKTLLSVNLAFAMSQIEHARVLLVDVDMRRPSVASFVGLLPDKGLNHYLEGAAVFDDICWTLNDSLDLVPTLQVNEKSAELLHNQQMVKFLAEARQRYNIIILDGPPLFPIVDAQVLAPLVDAAILVVREGKTPCELARQAAEVIAPKFIGSILNGAEHTDGARYYGSYYGYSNKSRKK